MRIRAAVLEQFAQPLVVQDVELDGPWGAGWMSGPGAEAVLMLGAGEHDALAAGGALLSADQDDGDVLHVERRRRLHIANDVVAVRGLKLGAVRRERRGLGPRGHGRRIAEIALLLGRDRVRNLARVRQECPPPSPSR